jgi:hypothetical protein
MFVIKHAKTRSLYGYHNAKTHIVGFRTVEHARQIAGNLSYWHDQLGEFPPSDEGILYTGNFRNPLAADLEVSIYDDGELNLDCAYRDWNLTVIENIDSNHITGTIQALAKPPEEYNPHGPLFLWKCNLEKDFNKDY